MNRNRKCHSIRQFICLLGAWLIYSLAFMLSKMRRFSRRAENLEIALYEKAALLGDLPRAHYRAAALYINEYGSMYCPEKAVAHLMAVFTSSRATNKRFDDAFEYLGYTAMRDSGILCNHFANKITAMRGFQMLYILYYSYSDREACSFLAEAYFYGRGAAAEAKTGFRILSEGVRHGDVRSEEVLWEVVENGALPCTEAEAAMYKRVVLHKEKLPPEPEISKWFFVSDYDFMDRPIHWLEKCYINPYLLVSMAMCFGILSMLIAKWCFHIA